jgi:hypothetical protein
MKNPGFINGIIGPEFESYLTRTLGFIPLSFF